MQPLLIYSSFHRAPNPWKVIILLHELNLPFTPIMPEWMQLHAPAFEAITANGRLPALVDPNNTDIAADDGAGPLTIWESGAILEYLVETYDTQNKLHSAGGRQKWLQKQYLHFQMSGQGPYFGQSVWFTNFHPEKIESARQRYIKEIERVTGVLDAVLRKEGKGYLTGGEASYVDLAFLPWYWQVQQRHMLKEGEEDLWEELTGKYEAFRDWVGRLEERESVKKTKEQMQDASLLPEAKDLDGKVVEPPK